MIKPMKPLLFILLFFCIISTSVIAAPSIEFEKTEFDIGEVETCRTVKVTFSFKNAGDEDLEIRSLTAGCGSCTNLRAGLMKLSPGQSSTIEVDFMTPGTGGAVSKHIIVNSNDPVRGAFKLMIVGKAIPVATLKPERLNFGTIRTGTTLEETILVTPTKPDGFTISKVDTTGKHLKVIGFTRADDGKGSYNVKIAISAGETPGRVMEAISIKTDMPGNPQISFLVFGNVSKEAPGDAKHP